MLLTAKVNMQAIQLLLIELFGSWFFTKILHVEIFSCQSSSKGRGSKVF